MSTGWIQHNHSFPYGFSVKDGRVWFANRNGVVRMTGYTMAETRAFRIPQGILSIAAQKTWAQRIFMHCGHRAGLEMIGDRVFGVLDAAPNTTFEMYRLK